MSTLEVDTGRCSSRMPTGYRIVCDKAVGHSGEHSGFDHQAGAVRWSDPPQEEAVSADDDLKREVRETLTAELHQWLGGDNRTTVERLVPAVVRLIEAHRDPLIAEPDNHHNAAACQHCGELISTAVVEARKAALHEAADELEALVQSTVAAHLKWPEMEPIPLPVSKWLHGRADAQCPTL